MGGRLVQPAERRAVSAARRSPLSRTRAPKCPAFKSKDSVLQRPNDETARPVDRLSGPARVRRDGYSVVWWDPGAGGGLTLDEKPPFGVRRDDLIVKDVPRHVVADGRSQYDRWRQQRAHARAAGAVPSLRVATVREVAALPTGDSLQTARVTMVDVIGSRDKTASRGQAFGLLVHEIVALAPLVADRARLRAVAAVQAQLLGQSAEDAEAAAARVERLLAHELMARARSAEQGGKCRRETPVMGLVDGTVVEGVVDMAFEENGEWVVVDFKTDHEISAAGEERYKRQVAAYCAAIHSATGLSARGCLVRL